MGVRSPFNISEIIVILSTLLALSSVDYYHLARTVQVEAKLNTMDEYCVAVSILNRVRSPLYPNTVAEVVYSPNQYEGLQKRIPSVEHSVFTRLQNNDKMIQAYNIIGDRTDFKGQSMLKYRVSSEDPMCHAEGNFYHYNWQF